MNERMGHLLLRSLVLAALAAVVALGWKERERFVPVARGELAPAYAAPSLSGDTVSLASLRGKAVLLNVWATWCAPCRWEMPALERLHRQLRGEGLEVVAVSVDAASGPLGMPGEAGGEVRSMVHELGLTFTVLLDPEGRIQQRFGVQGLPTTYLIDRQGRIVARVLGPALWDEAPQIDRIRKLLES